MNATLAPRAPIVHEHHERLARHVDRMPQTGELIDTGQPAELRFALDETCGFLTELLLPHMEAAERNFYPELERLFQNRHSMTPMRREHAEIRRMVSELDVARQSVGEQRLSPRDAIRVRRLLFGLYALLKMHLPEELLYADMVEHGATPEWEAALEASMEHAGRTTF